MGLRTRFNRDVVSYCYCCEHDELKHVNKSKQLFERGQKDIMLVTERFHFYFRYLIKGGERVIFCGVPQYEEFYAEMVNWLPTTGSYATNCLWCSYDFLQLQRIVGTKRAYQMQKSTQSLFMFLDSKN